MQALLCTRLIAALIIKSVFTIYVFSLGNKNLCAAIAAGVLIWRKNLCVAPLGALCPLRKIIGTAMSVRGVC